MTDPTVYGMGGAADGLVQARVTADGKIDELRIDPQVMRHSANRSSTLEDLAEDIKTAVNQAIDDLGDQAARSAGEIMDTLGADLNQVTAGFERAMEQITDDIVRAQRRLEG